MSAVAYVRALYNRSPMMNSIRFLCFLLLASLAGRATAGEDPAVAKARIHLRAGIADYDEGRYAEAASQMEQAYAIKPVADLQYNLAQCYERLDRLKDAIKAYEVYLDGSANAPDRDAVGKRIVNLRERVKAEDEGRKSVAPAPQCHLGKAGPELDSVATL